jgi:hypothetical protein
MAQQEVGVIKTAHFRKEKLKLFSFIHLFSNKSNTLVQDSSFSKHSVVCNCQTSEMFGVLYVYTSIPSYTFMAECLITSS